jgi:hypothetical protein
LELPVGVRASSVTAAAAAADGDGEFNRGVIRSVDGHVSN